MPSDQPGDPAPAQVPTRGEEVRAHWGIILAAFVGITTGAWSLPVYVLGPLSKSLEASFAWPRADIIVSLSLLGMGTMVGTPLVGWLSDRFAPRLVALGSILIFALSMAALTLVDGNLWLFRFLYFSMGCFGAGSGGLIFTRAIGSWFRSARGLALGIALSGTGFAAFGAPLFAQWLLSFTGWREVYLCFAAIVLFVTLPIVAIFLKMPQPGEMRDAAPAVELWGVTRREAMRDARFYLLLASVGLFGTFIGGLIVQIVPMLTDKGMTPMRAAQIASLLGAAIIIGRLIIGWLLDRLPPALVGFGVFSFGAAGALLFVLGGTGFAGVAVFGVGLVLGAEIDLLSFLTLRYFGNRHYGEIYGLLFAGYSGCAMTSPVIAAALVIWGGYDALYIGTVIAFETSGLLLLALALGRKENPIRPAII